MSFISNCTATTIKDAATSLINGDLVAFPTETVYGLGADAGNEMAVKKIYQVKGRSLDLTFKEFELLKYLAQHPGRVFSRSQLLQEIWGYDYFGGTRTVDVHIRRLRSKLGPEFESIIDTVRNVGYRFAITNAGSDAASEVKI